MGTQLDIHDVCAGNPLAQKQLDAMREALKTTAGNIKSLRAANPCTTFDKWLAVIEEAQP